MEKTSVLEKHFIFLTLLLVCFLAVPIYSNFSKELNATEKVDQKNDSTLDSYRGPASVVVKEKVLDTYQFTKSFSVQVGCELTKKFDTVDGTHLRLIGQPCVFDAQNSTKDIQIQIVNKTNGFTASVINTKNLSYTTDFIDLKEGENNIEIVHLSGAEVIKKQQISIQRALASVLEK